MGNEAASKVMVEGMAAEVMKAAEKDEQFRNLILGMAEEAEQRKLY